MPVDFLTPEQKQYYAQFEKEVEPDLLDRYFHLDESDISFIQSRRSDQNRLGVALQLTAVRYLGVFVSDFNRIPSNVIKYVSNQIGVESPKVIQEYSKWEETRREHIYLLKERYGYQSFKTPWTYRLARYLYARSWIDNERPGLMFDMAISWLISQKVLLPGLTTLTRLISEIRERANQRLWNMLSILPDKEQKVQLESLLEVPENERISSLDSLKKGKPQFYGIFI